MPTPTKVKRKSTTIRRRPDPNGIAISPFDAARIVAATLDVLAKSLSHGERLATLADHLATLAQQDRVRADTLAGEVEILRGQLRSRGRS